MQHAHGRSLEKLPATKNNERRYIKGICTSKKSSTGGSAQVHRRRYKPAAFVRGLPRSALAGVAAAENNFHQAAAENN